MTKSTRVALTAALAASAVIVPIAFVGAKDYALNLLLWHLQPYAPYGLLGAFNFVAPAISVICLLAYVGVVAYLAARLWFK